jgi:DNA-binding transcriptional LysR family regulator
VPALGRIVAAFRSRPPDCQVILHEVDTWDPYRALRLGDIDVLVNWLALEEPDLTAGPVISLHDRGLVVARNHRLAGRTSVLMEDLAGEQVAQPPPSYPPALYDAILPPRTPSGRPIARTQVIRSVSETAAHVAHGRIVHITMAGVPVFSRDDVAFIPIQDLAPAALGLICKTARHSAKIRALAGAAWALGPLRVTCSTAADRPPDVGTSGPDPGPAAG